MPYTRTAQELFAKLLPAWLQSARVDVAGPVLFEIDGSGGGAWLVDFGAKRVTSAPATRPVLTAIVRAGERDFMALVEGRMSVDDGLVTRRLTLSGDAGALAHLVDGLGRLAERLAR